MGDTLIPYLSTSYLGNFPFLVRILKWRIHAATSEDFNGPIRSAKKMAENCVNLAF